MDASKKDRELEAAKHGRLAPLGWSFFAAFQCGDDDDDPTGWAEYSIGDQQNG